MVKIALDAGHSLNTPGKRTPDGEREWSFNDVVLRAAWAELEKYHDVQLLRLDDPSGKTDVSLVARTNKANNWKADVLVSIHHNALNSRWGGHGGVETFTMDHKNANPKSVALAKIVQPKIVAAMGLRDRGVKKSNLHMLRASNMMAILTEGGFMDSTTDIGALRSTAKLQAQGIAIAQGLVEYFGLKRKGHVPITPPIEVPKQEDDEMNKKLNKTQKDDMRKLLRKAFESGVFTVDHSGKVENMTRAEALDLIISYVARTA